MFQKDKAKFSKKQEENFKKLDELQKMRNFVTTNVHDNELRNKNEVWKNEHIEVLTPAEKEVTKKEIKKFQKTQKIKQMRINIFNKNE